MANYLVQGKLGTGKGKFTVGKMQEALKKGLRVATNMNLFMEHLLDGKSHASAFRLPDKPTAADLLAIGPGCSEEDKYDEDKYGIMVLDELATWLNARTHASPDRAAFLDWVVHARKHRWHVYFQSQDIGMIDRQMRDGLLEYTVRCIRCDKIKIPVVGPLLGKLGKLKGVHVANISMVDMPGFVVDREWFKGTALHSAYDTLQIFKDWDRKPSDEGFKDEVYIGPFSYLSAWHLKGRHEPEMLPRTFIERLRDTPARPKPVVRPKPRVMVLLAKLPAEEAWAYARRMSTVQQSYLARP